MDKPLFVLIDFRKIYDCSSGQIDISTYKIKYKHKKLPEQSGKKLIEDKEWIKYKNSAQFKKDYALNMTLKNHKYYIRRDFKELRDKVHNYCLKVEKRKDRIIQAIKAENYKNYESLPPMPDLSGFYPVNVRKNLQKKINIAWKQPTTVDCLICFFDQMHKFFCNEIQYTKRKKMRMVAYANIDKFIWEVLPGYWKALFQIYQGRALTDIIYRHFVSNKATNDYYMYLSLLVCNKNGRTYAGRLDSLEDDNSSTIEGGDYEPIEYEPNVDYEEAGCYDSILINGDE